MLKKEIADIYVRLSDQDRDKKDQTDESESIQNQKIMLTKYCMDNGWSIHGIYSDEDYSGADCTRPAWNQMLSDCENGKCTVVVCKTLSRFSRDVEMIERYIHGKFPEWGVRFVSVVDQSDTNVKGNKKARQINSLINEWYLQDLSDNIKSTLSSKRKNGEFVGAFAPYGYRIDPENKNHLVIDPVAAPVVVRIFNLYISGNGYIAIAKKLNAEQIAPPCVRKKQLGSKYYNFHFETNAAPAAAWSDASVYAIIRRPEYTGALVQGRQEVVNYKTKCRRSKPKEEWDIVENCHEAIISKEIFLKAIQIRSQRGKAQKIPTGQCYSLAKKAYCDVCGNTMWKMSYALADGRYQYLTCRTRKTRDGQCTNAHSIRLDELETQIVHEINQMLDRYYDENRIGEIQKRIAPDFHLKSIETELHALSVEIRRNEARLAQLYTDKLDGLISVDEFLRYKARYQQEQTNHQKRTTLLQREMQMLNRPVMKDEPDIRKKYRHIDQLTFEIADQWIERVYIGALNDDHKREIRIQWKV